MIKLFYIFHGDWAHLQSQPASQDYFGFTPINKYFSFYFKNKIIIYFNKIKNYNKYYYIKIWEVLLWGIMNLK